MPDQTPYACFLRQVIAAPPCGMLNANIYALVKGCEICGLPVVIVGEKDL